MGRFEPQNEVEGAARGDLCHPGGTYSLQLKPGEDYAQTMAMLLPLARWLVPALDVRYAWFQQQELPERAYDSTLLVTDRGRFLDTGIDGLPTCATFDPTAPALKCWFVLNSE